MVAVGVAATVALMSSSCTASQDDTVTPHEARNTLISTIRDSAALLDVSGWNSDGAPGVQSCGSDGQSAKTVTGTAHPSQTPLETVTIYEREGDFDLYLPAPGHGQTFSPNPPPSVPATTDPLGNHNLIASQEGNRQALRDMYLATETERMR